MTTSDPTQVDGLAHAAIEHPTAGGSYGRNREGLTGWLMASPAILLLLTSERLGLPRGLAVAAAILIALPGYGPLLRYVLSWRGGSHS